tara:strand:- start:2553 stop:3452 length:900 start_codon:yes stop_codon:yes gene_type:complete
MASPLNRRSFLLLLSAVVVAILIVGYRRTVSLERQPIDRPIQFLKDDAIKGSDAMLENGATLLIGEIHGTWEIPIAVASLVRQALATGNEVILCVEIPTTEQESIDRFLNSDGEDRAVDDLLDTPFWVGQDGRASVGMFAMLELVRRLRSSGHEVHVHAIDLDWTRQPAEASAYYRDQAMAENLLQVRKDSPAAILITLAGNVHTRTAKGAPWDDQYTPMGWFVSQSLPDLVSFNIQIAGGDAWVMTEQGEGERALSGKNQGDDPFLLIDDTREIGYDGVFYIGRISAAKPVFTRVGGG